MHEARENFEKLQKAVDIFEDNTVIAGLVTLIAQMVHACLA